MAIEIHIGERVANVELLSIDGNKVQIQIDDKTYDVDISMIEHGVYSILHQNKSYNMELVKSSDDSKKYDVSTLYNTMGIEIVDVHRKYMKSRQKDDIDEGQEKIFTPMPGKVVKIPVKKGDKLEPGQTVIVVEAMKMQSEYKVKRECKIKDILVNEGDTVEGNQTLVVLE
ncbi:MAG: acetyl-CoA carboxylase biotin carboxyl carrier protein subunit [Bacteroidetes bacterium]|nr:acetyl-CoA carboxylase biotin carboxyl carrier protein subunit [Bacteroidota bacterium]